jgi:hypothetical protein
VLPRPDADLDQASRVPGGDDVGVHSRKMFHLAFQNLAR